MRDYILSQIRHRRHRLDALDRERVVLHAELRAYEDMLAHVGDDTASEPQAEPDPQPVRRRVPTIQEQDVGKAIAGLSNTWRQMLVALAKQGDKFKSEDAVRIARLQGVEFKPVNIRSQFSIYTGRGILQRLGGGYYRVSNEAAAILMRQAEYEEDPDGGTSGSSESSGGGVVRAVGYPPGKPEGAVPSTSTSVSVARETSFRRDLLSSTHLQLPSRETG